MIPSRLQSAYSAIPGLGLLVCLSWSIAVEGAEDLIGSLEDVIGKAPEKAENSSDKAQKTFYSLSSAEPDPNIQEYLRMQRMGYVLTAEEQLIVSEYQM